MDYNHINSFLDKFKKILFQKEELKNIVLSVVSKYIPKKIDPSSVKIKNGIICFDVSPIIKNEILIYKKKITDDIKDISSVNILDIK